MKVSGAIVPVSRKKRGGENDRQDASLWLTACQGPVAVTWDIFEICQRRVRIDVQEVMAEETDGRREIQE
jgi:hypothetical protein